MQCALVSLLLLGDLGADMVRTALRVQDESAILTGWWANSSEPAEMEI